MAVAPTKSPTKAPTKARGYRVVWDTFTPGDVDVLQDYAKILRYAMISRGSTSLQGYLLHDNPVSLRSLQLALTRASSIRASQGSPQENIGSLLSSHGLISEFGLRPRQGKQKKTSAVISIVPYGQEDLSFLTPSLLHERLMTLGDGVMATIKDIHFNRHRPECANVKLASSKGQTAYIMGSDSVWTRVSRATITERLVERAYGLLLQRFAQDEAYRRELPNEIMKWQMNFRNTRQKNGDAKERLLRWTWETIMEHGLTYREAMSHNQVVMAAKNQKRTKKR